MAAWELVWAASYRGLWREALKQVGVLLISGYGDMRLWGCEAIRLWGYGDMKLMKFANVVESKIFLRRRFCWTSRAGRRASIPTSRFPQLSTTWDKWLVLVFNSLASNRPNFRPPSTACYSPNSLPRRFEIHSFLHFVTFLSALNRFRFDIWSWSQVADQAELMAAVPRLKQRIAGKSLPMEKYACRKAERWHAQGGR